MIFINYACIPGCIITVVILLADTQEPGDAADDPEEWEAPLSGV